MFGHPVGAFEMAVMDLARTLRFVFRINAKQNSCDLSDRCTGVFGIEETHIELQVVTIVDRDAIVGGRGVFERRVRRTVHNEVFERASPRVNELETMR